MRAKSKIKAGAKISGSRPSPPKLPTQQPAPTLTPAERV